MTDLFKNTYNSISIKELMGELTIGRSGRSGRGKRGCSQSEDTESICVVEGVGEHIKKARLDGEDATAEASAIGQQGEGLVYAPWLRIAQGLGAIPGVCVVAACVCARAYLFGQG